MTRDQDVIGVCLRHAGRNRANTGFGNELHHNASARVDSFQVVNQLCQILDRIDVVVRWWRDELNAWHRMPQAGYEVGDLVSGKLSPLTWLSALHDFDLELLRASEILGGYAEAGGGDLLDAIVRAVAITQSVIVAWVFASLARVGTCTHAVHRDRQRRMGFRRERAERHRRGNESPADLFRGLDFIARYRVTPSEPQEVARAGWAPGCVFRHEGGVARAHPRSLVCSSPTTYGLLESHHDMRRPPVIFAFFPEAHPSMVRQGRCLLRHVRGGVACQHIFAQLFEAYTPYG